MITPTFVQFFVFVLFLVIAELYGEAAVKAALCLGANPESAVICAVGVFHGALIVVECVEHHIVNLHEDDAFRNTGFLHLTFAN